jgi:transcriptional regulator with XRE-family HTH domain
MLDMSQTNIADALGLTFQQVQKYEKGSNRISASRLQHLSQILQVPVPFFFEGAPAARAGPVAKPADDPSYSYVADFLATSDGLALVKAFVRIEDAKLRRVIVRLVKELVSESA